MFAHIEAFHRPRTIPEALRLLRRQGKGGRFVAGGTDVAVEADPSIRYFVDVTRLGLNYIRRKGSAWVIGATTTMTDLERSPAILALANGILAQAAATCGSVQNRNMATVGGNLANASPAADTATPLLALDAQVVLASAAGRRKIPLADFFTGSRKTVLGGALLVEIIIPTAPRGGRAGWSFQKLGRNEGDISIVNAAAGLQLDAHGTCKWARLALGAVGPTPFRVRSAENLLAGQPLEAHLMERACDEVARQVHPITDVRASAEYRREMSRVLARRALRDCAAQAGWRR
jgi:probable selenate reductase FAD-binding subunit